MVRCQPVVLAAAGHQVRFQYVQQVVGTTYEQQNWIDFTVPLPAGVDPPAYVERAPRTKVIPSNPPPAPHRRHAAAAAADPTYVLPESMRTPPAPVAESPPEPQPAPVEPTPASSEQPPSVVTSARRRQ